MREKQVRTNRVPNTGKSPKRIQDPDSYKNSLISWQFNLMDFEFEYGWNTIIDRIAVAEVQALQLELLESGSGDNALYTSLEECAHQHFMTYADLWTVIQRDNVKISIDDLKIVLKHIKANFFWHHIFPKLRNFETMRWGEFERQTHGKRGKSKHHWVNVQDLIKQAQDRLIELNLDDYESLFSVRLSGKKRIWGIREGNHFKLLWFDANHSICPSKKK